MGDENNPRFLKGARAPTHTYFQLAPGGWCPASNSGFFSSRENVLVLDIFFEALNYETVEQKAAYEVSELLGVYGEPGSAEVWIGWVTVS